MPLGSLPPKRLEYSPRFGICKSIPKGILPVHPTRPTTESTHRSAFLGLPLLAIVLAVGAGSSAAFFQGLPGGFKYEVHDKNRPQPSVVTPGAACVTTAPSDAIVLFGGGTAADTSAFVKAGSQSPIGWNAENGVLSVTPGTGDIETKQHFGDCQLHVEWMVPKELKCASQHGCNSGVFFFSRYELQILNSNGNQTYCDGMAGALYGQYPPLVNACRAQGEWNTYDIIFRGPRFDAAAGIVRTASMTVLFNGVLVQDDVEMLGATAHAARAKYSPHGETGPIKIQDHGDPLKFRNIWVRPLGAPQVAE